jgi:hypothetical protein
MAGLTPHAEEIADAQNIEELNELEKVCISFGRAIGLRLTNTSDGGDVVLRISRSRVENLHDIGFQ